MTIEARANAADLTPEDTAACIAQLQQLMKQEPSLSKAFVQLNGSLLYPSALEEENVLRSQKVHQLYQRLAKIK